MGFTFSKEQRRTLAGQMKRLPADLVQSFLNRCEQAISEWQADWPLERMAGNKGASDQLRALSDALLRVRCEIMKLPEGASCELWNRLHPRWQDSRCNWPMRAVSGAFLSQLLMLEQEAGILAGDLSSAGGVVKYCERDLADRLVQAYFDSFHPRLPSYGNGPFMRVLGEIENILPMPGGGKLTMGREIVSDSIEWHKRREAWQAGMYEFPTKKES